MELKSDAGTRRKWPYDFSLTLNVALDCRGLTLSLTGVNTGEKEFSVTEAFHPYLLRRELEKIENSGSGVFRTWNPNAGSHLRTTGLGPEDWRIFVCVENGTFDRERAYVLKPGQSNVLSRTIAPLRK